MQYDKVDPATCECVKYCPEATPPKTNAEKIRAMTDEELAKLLSGEDVYPWCAEDCKFDKCYDCVMDWLKKVVKE